eukprot:gene2027-3023_t
MALPARKKVVGSRKHGAAATAHVRLVDVNSRCDVCRIVVIHFIGLCPDSPPLRHEDDLVD